MEIVDALTNVRFRKVYNKTKYFEIHKIITLKLTFKKEHLTNI